MEVEEHVDSCVVYGCVRMGGGIVQEPEEFVALVCWAAMDPSATNIVGLTTME